MLPKNLETTGIDRCINTIFPASLISEEERWRSGVELIRHFWMKKSSVTETEYLDKITYDDGDIYKSISSFRLSIMNLYN